MKRRQQQSFSRDRRLVHPIWIQIGTYAFVYGDRAAALKYSRRFNIGNVREGKRTLDAATKIVKKFRERVARRDFDWDPHGRKGHVEHPLELDLRDDDDVINTHVIKL